ncbi:RNase adapter RapZ [Eubacteriales bacterium KG127]
METIENSEKMSVFLVTGLSGAGKTVVADWFEDKGYYCVDNMPPSLIKNFIDLSMRSSTVNRVAIVVDARGGEFFEDLLSVVEILKKDSKIKLKILFMEASDKALMRRFNETRRNHPLYMGAADAKVIEKERELLSGIRKEADFVLDTTGMKVANLKQVLDNAFQNDIPKIPFTVNVQSFGYKRGLPEAADVIFDVRFIPNPYYVPTLKKLTGKNKRVRDYVMRQDIALSFREKFMVGIETLIPYYQKEGKNHLNIAFGCTGGQHRSVAMAEYIADKLKKDGYQVTLEHRDIR